MNYDFVSFNLFLLMQSSERRKRLEACSVDMLVLEEDLLQGPQDSVTPMRRLYLTTRIGIREQCYHFRKLLLLSHIITEWVRLAGPIMGHVVQPP